MMGSLLGLLAIGALAWFWRDSLRARERAVRSCALACKEMDMQFLDQTVALSGLSLRRDEHGRLQIHRLYAFELSASGADRRKGVVNMLGSKIEYVEMEHPDGPTIVEPNPSAGRRPL